MQSYIPYQQQVTQHTCPVCQASFLAHPAKQYCTTRCRKRAERTRVRSRDAEVLPQNLTLGGDDRIVNTVENPTAEQLTQMAAALGVMPGRAFRVTGTLPPGYAEGESFSGCTISRQWDGVRKCLSNDALMTKE